MNTKLHALRNRWILLGIVLGLVGLSFIDWHVGANQIKWLVPTAMTASALRQTLIQRFPLVHPQLAGHLLRATDQKASGRTIKGQVQQADKSDTALPMVMNSGWSGTGAMNIAREGHTATILENGKVLVAGGSIGSSIATKGAELYDPVTGIWSGTGAMSVARSSHTATLLGNGKVLVVGGRDGLNLTNSAELYDPVTGIWSGTGVMSEVRYHHVTTLLGNGKVLVAGGIKGSLILPIKTAELYDPVVGTWSNTGAMNEERGYHTATLLESGKVLVVGGGLPNTPSAELYDPVTGNWGYTGAPSLKRRFHSATPLWNSKVLIVGGEDSGFDPLNSAELYDPVAGVWSSTGAMGVARRYHTATLLGCGKVLVTGGRDTSAITSAELYDPVTGTWSSAGAMNEGRYFHTATQLANGKVLVAGGDFNLNSAELYEDSCTVPPITISPAILPNAAPNIHYTQQLTQTGGTGPITWSISAGAMPNGVELLNSGLLSGTSSAAGTFNFAVKVTDANGYVGTRIYTLVVTCLPIIVSPATIPTATTGMPYEQAFSAAFNNLTMLAAPSSNSAKLIPPPLNFTFTLTGSVPSGLTFIPYFVFGPNFAGSLITGTPREAGIFNFTIKAASISDSSCQGSRDYTLVVQNVAPPVTAQIADPLVCTGPGNVVAITATVTNSNASAQPGNFTATLNPTLKALPGTCTANVGTCSVVSSSTVTWMGNLTANQTVTIAYSAQISDDAEPGLPLCVTSVATVGVSLPANVTACSRINCPAVGPGVLPQAASPMSDQRAGSVLIYNVYTSSTDPTRQNTRLNLTNTHPALSANVHLFFVDGASCSVADSFLCLTPNQTTSFLASDFDPGTTGYVVAVATDESGCPVNFNFLIGDEYVKFASGHAANLSAQAIAAVAGGLPFCDQNSSTATLSFDGVSYAMVPRVLALDNVASRADGNDTLLVVNRIGGNLATGASTLGTLFGILYNDAEAPQSFSVTGACQLLNSLSNNFPRTAPRFEQFIPAGRSGWLKLSSQSDFGITGAAINFNADAGTNANAFNQGHNLHAQTLSSAAGYTIPVFPPGC